MEPSKSSKILCGRLACRTCRSRRPCLYARGAPVTLRTKLHADLAQAKTASRVPLVVSGGRAHGVWCVQGIVFYPGHELLIRCHPSRGYLRALLHRQTYGRTAR
eukprot:scaffold16430_cov71-Phaeocystis_antarctica.AAC.4